MFSPRPAFQLSLGPSVAIATAAQLIAGNYALAQETLVEQALFSKPGTSIVRASEMQEPVLHLPDERRNADAALANFVEQNGKPPNVLVILIDDMGWGDLGVYGGGTALGQATPNLDALARSGLRLTSAYAQPTCSPSRATLLTGRLPIRHGVFGPPQVGEDIGGGVTAEATLGALLQEQGYYTAMLGKWHLGEDERQQPQYNGFDEYYGFYGSIKNYTQWRDADVAPFYVNDPQIIEYVEGLDGFVDAVVRSYSDQPAETVYPMSIERIANIDIDLMRQAIAFVERMEDDEQPWFLYHSMGKVHYDSYPADGFAGASAAKGPYQDAVVESDYIVGNIIDALERTGQRDDTLVVFVSDNGPGEDTWPDTGFTPFRGAKGSTWEGGVRIPAILSWPGMIPAERVSDGLFDLADVFNTTLALAGAELPADRYIDGIDQLPLLLNEDGQSARGAVFNYINSDLTAYRVGPYKQHFHLLVTTPDEGIPGNLNAGTLIRTTGPYMLNLYLDPKERRPLGTQYAITTGYMRQFLARHRASFAK